MGVLFVFLNDIYFQVGAHATVEVGGQPVGVGDLLTMWLWLWDLGLKVWQIALICRAIFQAYVNTEGALSLSLFPAQLSDKQRPDTE